MHIFKRKMKTKDIWYIRFKNPKTNRITVRSTGCKYKSDALKYLMKFEKEYKAIQEAEFETVLLYDFIWDFLKYKEIAGFTWNTVKTYQVTTRVMKEFFGNVPIHTITTQQCRNFLEIRLRHSVYNARRDRIHLSGLFTRAIELGYIKENPVRLIKQFKIPEKQPIYFTEEEITRLYYVVEDKDMLDVFRFAFNTGFRTAEIVALRWDQVDFEKGVISLTNRNHMTKTKKVRSVPMNKVVRELLERRLINKHDYVFIVEGKTMKPEDLSNRVRRLMRKFNFRRGLSMHSCRHTFASMLVQNDTPLYTVSKLLGHTNLRTTEIYAHLGNQNFIDAVGTLNI